MSRQYGWKPPEARHRAFAAANHFAAGFGVKPQDKGFAINQSTNLEHIFGPVLDQGAVGDCTANGGEEVLAAARAVFGMPALFFSRYYLYARTRKDIMGISLTDDSGATITDMVQALMKFGVCTETTWPSTDPSGWMQDPSPHADTEAAQHKALRCYALSDLDWLCACLTLGFPIVFGFSVPQSFETLGVDGQLQMPQPNEPFVGGHCVVMIGHDDNHDNGDGTKGAFLCRNSWGPNFGLNGNFWMPFGYITSFLATDCWTVHSEIGAGG